jgi:CheY-like chemotaxis protein
MREPLEEIKKAADRSAALTQQLLAFSRKQVQISTVLDLNSVIRDAEKMLRRMIGEDIELITDLQEELKCVEADPGQLHQVLMNLAVNARDAMPRGGKLRIETREVTISEERGKTRGSNHPGTYILCAVTDTGEGMTEEVLQHIFEPFYTTKEQGKGTGLGLAVVHGVINQNKGHIRVESEPGRGTRFEIYLPSIEPDAEPATRATQHLPAPRGGETILLVEDEDALRGFSLKVLRNCGYTVLEAAKGEEAIEIFETSNVPIDLLITDVVMPGMGGRVLAEQILAQHPETKVIYMSGYTDDAVMRHGIARDEVAFLAKPFSPSQLARRVYEVLNGRIERSAAASR